MVEPRLARVIAEVFKVDSREVSEDLRIGSLEPWDSLGHLQLVLRIEQAFGVRFLTEEIPTLTSVACLQRALAKAKPQATDDRRRVSSRAS